MRREGQMRIAYDSQTLERFEAFMPIARAHELDTEILTPEQIAETRTSVAPPITASSLLMLRTDFIIFVSTVFVSVQNIYR